MQELERNARQSVLQLQRIATVPSGALGTLAAAVNDDPRMWRLASASDAALMCVLGGMPVARAAMMTLAPSEVLGDRSYEAGARVAYRPLNSSGQATGVDFTLTEPVLGTGTPVDPSILPPGWGGNGLLTNQARGHLLARSLGGSGYIKENLVTLQQYPANSPEMSRIESQIASAVRGGQVVSGSVVPVYGLSPAPRGITFSVRGTGGYYLDVTVLNPVAR
jgi:hypothetical protein